MLVMMQRFEKGRSTVNSSKIQMEEPRRIVKTLHLKRAKLHAPSAFRVTDVATLKFLGQELRAMLTA